MNRFRYLLTHPTLRQWFLAALLVLASVISVYAQDYTPVSTVNDDVITREIFFQRVRFVRWQYLREIEKLHEVTGGNFSLTSDYISAHLSDLQQPAVLGDAVLSQLEEERLLWQAGEALGVVPTLEDAQEVEAEFFSAWTEVDVANLASDAGAQTFISEWYASATAASGMSANDIRIVFETEALRNALYQRLVANVPTEEPAVSMRRILCAFHPDDLTNTAAPTEAERAAAQACVDKVLDQLAYGQSFADVAVAYSDDPGSASGGGDLGWVLESYLAEAYLNAITDAAIGAVIGPIEMSSGLHIIQIVDRGPQTLSDEQYTEAVQGYYTLWLDNLRAEATITRADDWNANLPIDPDLSTLPDDVRADLEAFSASDGS